MVPRAIAAHIIRVASYAGVDPETLRTLASGAARGQTADLVADRAKAYLQALEWLRMTEARLESRIHSDVRIANAQSAPVIVAGRKQPRFIRYHTLDSRGSQHGFPDEWVIDLRDFVLWTWENKKETGAHTPEQETWSAALFKVGPIASSFRWLGTMRPSHWDQLGRVTVLGLRPVLNVPLPCAQD